MTTNVFANFKAPGVRVTETTQGYRSLEIASFQSVYMVGSGSKGDFLTPTLVTSLADFTNQFGSSSSENSVKLFFRNNKRGLLYFTRTPVALRIQVTVSTAASGDYPITIASSGGSGTATYTATGSDTTATITSGLIAAINNSSVASEVTASAGSASNRLLITMDNPLHPFLHVTSTNNNLAIVNSRTTANDRREVIIDRVLAGTVYSLNFHGVSTIISYTATSNDTLQSIRDALITAIQANVTVNPTVTVTPGDGDNRFYISNVNTTTPIRVFVSSGGLGMRVINSLLDTPNSASFVYAIENSFDVEDELPQGFLICPQAFTSYTQADRLAVGLAMEAHCSDDRFDWVALIDAGPELSLTAAQAEGLLYTSPQGHSSFYYPSVIDLEGNIVPPSAAVAGMATRRYQSEGFQQPPAGAKFPLLGVTDVFTRISTEQQETVNSLGINLIRNLRNKGVVVWAMRTRSSNEFYTFLHTRVIMNVLNGTLRTGFDNELFSVIDGQGVLLNSISQTAASVCSRLWRGKALFGATEAEAFEVKCDFENNTPDELEQGNVLLEVYVVPAPAMEKLLINTVRLSIGTLPLNQSQVEAQLIQPAVE